jgi:hypothetical protein
MKRINVPDIANAAIRTAAEQRKLTSAFLAETDPLQPNAFLYCMPWARR